MNPLQQIIWSSGPSGRVTQATLSEVAALAPLFPVTVRCDGLRFTASAQDVRALAALVTLGGGTVERMEFPVGAVDLAEEWRPPVLCRGAAVPVEFEETDAVRIEFV